MTTPAVLRALADALERGEALAVELRVLPSAPVAGVSSNAAKCRAYRHRRKVSPVSDRHQTTPNDTTPTPGFPLGSPSDGRTDQIKERAENKAERSGSGSSSASEPARVRAREAQNDTDTDTGVARDSRGRPLVECPPDIGERLEKSGQVAVLAKRHQVETWDVRAVLDEFTDYWRNPEREGDPRRLRASWMTDALRRVSDRAREGFLRGAGKAPGLLEHAERSGRTLRQAEAPEVRRAVKGQTSASIAADVARAMNGAGRHG